MAFITDIEDALLTLLNTELPVEVIIDYDEGPEPENDYGVIGLLASDPIHRQTITSNKTETGLEEVIRQDFLLRFSVRFYGDTSYENAFVSQALLKSRILQEDLFDSANLSFAGTNSIRRNPEHRRTSYVQRAIYEVKFLAGFEFRRTVDWFNTVSYEGKYISQDGEVVLVDAGTVSASDTTT